MEMEELGHGSCGKGMTGINETATINMHSFFLPSSPSILP